MILGACLSTRGVPQKDSWKLCSKPHLDPLWKPQTCLLLLQEQCCGQLLFCLSILPELFALAQCKWETFGKASGKCSFQILQPMWFRKNIKWGKRWSGIRPKWKIPVTLLAYGNIILKWYPEWVRLTHALGTAVLGGINAGEANSSTLQSQSSAVKEL